MTTEKSAAGCTCLDKMRKQIIKDESNDKQTVVSVMFVLGNLVNTNQKHIRKRTGQHLYMRVEKKNRKGEVKIKDVKTFIGHDFCPFCGKKYIP